jgi:hypothetical protein
MVSSHTVFVTSIFNHRFVESGLYLSDVVWIYTVLPHLVYYSTSQAFFFFCESSGFENT